MLDTNKTRLLVVDDNNDLRNTLCSILEHGGFEVLAAGDVKGALKLIAAHSFDVLVSDLHMPNNGDGLTVVSAMRHSNPKALTIIFSAHPDLGAAAAAILAQADEVFVKPHAIVNLVEVIRAKVKAGPDQVRAVSTIATILEEEADSTVKDWLLRVDADKHILCIRLNDVKRAAHLSQLFRDLVYRLRHPLDLGSRALISTAAAEHGILRKEQGYTAAMLVEESRILQVSIFQTLHNNLYRVNFSLLLLDVMTIADEVDSQLAQAMAAYVGRTNADPLPVVA